LALNGGRTHVIERSAIMPSSGDWSSLRLVLKRRSSTLGPPTPPPIFPRLVAVQSKLDHDAVAKLSKDQTILGRTPTSGMRPQAQTMTHVQALTIWAAARERARDELLAGAVLLARQGRAAIRRRSTARMLRPLATRRRGYALLQSLAAKSPSNLLGRSPNSHGLGPGGVVVLTRVRATGESPRSPRYLCISSSCFLAIASHGLGWM
jgi:hypothetical protein